MKKILSLVVSLTLIAGICAGVLAFVNELTKDPIAKMEEQKKQSAAKAVMPQGVAEVGEEGGIFTGRDVSGEVVGYAVEGSDPDGYGGDIVLMVGFEADKKTVVCYKTLKAKETPGLGMKLDTPEFSSQFTGKNATSLAVKKDGGDIDAITSATITSRAVCKAIADASRKLGE